MKVKPESKQPNTPIRIPDELKSWLKHAAIDNRRSLSNEVVYRLEQSRAAKQIAPPQGATA